MNQLTLSSEELSDEMKTIRSLFEEHEKIKLKTLSKKDISYGVAYIYDPHYYDCVQQVGLLFIHTKEGMNVYYLFTDNYRQIKKDELYIHSKFKKNDFDNKWINTLELEQDLSKEWLLSNAFFMKTEEMEKETKHTLAYIKENKI